MEKVFISTIPMRAGVVAAAKVLQCKKFNIVMKPRNFRGFCFTAWQYFQPAEN
jgi:hypothetical protein